MPRPEPDNDGAARWAIRLDAGALAPADQSALDTWLEADPRRDGALLRAQATLSYLDRGRALGGLAAEGAGDGAADDTPGGAEDDAGDKGRRRAGERGTWEVDRADEGEAGTGQSLEPARWRMGRRGFLGAAAASGIAATLAGLFVFTPRARQLGTGIGEVRQIPLSDGSVATLNTSSKLAVTMADHQRTVRIEDGEAWFRVAHDKTRPFVVEAGDIRVKAVGTAFSVRKRGSGADVLVTEGIVDTWVVGHEGTRKRIAAGSRGFVSQAQDQGAPNIEVAAAPQAIDRALAWRSGELALDGETLQYAVSEINRYNVRKLVIGDPSLASEPLVGYFHTTEPEDFGRAVATMIGARVVDEGDTIRLVRAGPHQATGT
ncbi:MAG: FecR domain-containing protein [Sphingomonas sp.]